MKYSYITRGDSSPKNKPRIYFSCHSDDLLIYLQDISDDIFEHYNAVIWYGENVAADDGLLELEQMQLFIFPITAKYLMEPNRSRDTELPFAIQNNIPVLPIMMEPGLEVLFAQKCGDLQFLDKSTIDITSIPYKDKLKKYLDNILLDDSEIKKIQGAFDAYIFLSYRKKDRVYAQKLMRLIHNNDFCEAVAIWYDEFLTPGESFNHSIEDALKRSDLFSMVVTPNIVNEDNYIMDIEYPKAKENGKNILPFEMLKTEGDTLRRLYSEIPTPINPNDESSFVQALRDYLPVAVEKDKHNPMHNFFVGLAYLSGVDVEVDRDRAFDLIFSAAEAGLYEAMKKIVSMYSTGEGVAKNTERAIKWQKKIITKLGDSAEESLSEDDAISYLRESMILAEMAYSAEDYESAEDACERSYNLAKILSFGSIEKNPLKKAKTLFNKYVLNRSHYEESFFFMLKSCRLILDIYTNLGIRTKIDEWNKKAIFLYTAVQRIEPDSQTAVEFLQFTYRIALSSIESGNITGALNWINSVSNYCDNLEDEDLSIDVQYRKTKLLLIVSKIYVARGEYEKAVGSLNTYEKELLHFANEYPKNKQFSNEVMQARIEQAKIFTLTNAVDDARAILDDVQRKINSEKESMEISSFLQILQTQCHITMGRIDYINGEYKKAVEVLNKAYTIIHPLSECLFDAEHTRDVCAILSLQGDCYFAMKQYKKAYDNYYEANELLASVNVWMKAINDCRTLAELSEKLLNASINLNDKNKIREWHEKALWERTALVDGLEVKIGLKNCNVNDALKNGKIESPQYKKDVEDLQRLKLRESEILNLIRNAPSSKETLFEALKKERPMMSGIDLILLRKKIYEFIEVYLKSHPNPAIRTDLMYLSLSLSENSEIMDQERHHADHIQMYFLEHLKPFAWYDEESMLILAFCGYDYLYAATKVVGGKEKAIADYKRFFTDIVFWKYPVEQVKYKELWLLLFEWIYL